MITSIDCVPKGLISIPCSSPHCPFSNLIFCVNVTTLFPERPLITGFKIPGPVVIADNPGILSNDKTGLFDKLISFNESLLTLITLFLSDSLKGVDTTTSCRLTGIIVSFSTS